MVKRIKTKYIYMSFLLIIILIGIVVLPTYAKFPSNYITNNDIVGLNLSFDVGISNIEEYQEVSVPAGKTKIFNVKVTNNSGALAYYGVWYRMNTPEIKTPDITIARLDGTETTTSGSLNNNEIKTVSVIIKNGTDSDIIVDIGINSSTTSTNDIEYIDGKRLISGVYSLNMMKTLFSTDGDKTYYKSDTYREKILNASFVDYIDTSNAVATWDVSQKGNGNIIAWVENNATSGYYDLYFGSNDLIYATNLYAFFYNMTNLESASINNLDTSNVKNMSLLFSGCSKLVTVDLSSFDTSNVTDMIGTFWNCSSLTSLDLSNWNTSKVTTMWYMFEDCSNLTSLNLSNWNTSNVTTMRTMFYNCSKLTNLDLSSFDTSKVIEMSYMFQNCSSLTSLNLNNFNTGNVTTMLQMFQNCSSLTSLNVSSFNTSNVTTMGNMFYECSSLTSLNLSNWNTGNVTAMSNMFYNCNKLTSLNLSNWNTSNVTNMEKMFISCSGLTSLDLSNWNTSKVTTLWATFYGCSSLSSLNLSSFSTPNVTTMKSTFSGMTNLATLNISNFNTSNVTDMLQMFYNCSSLKSLNLSHFNTSKVTTMYGMFNGCSSLTSLNLSNFNTSKVTEMTYMFQNCSSLTSLNLSSFGTGSVTTMAYMFNGCSGLTSLNISNFNTSKVTSMKNMFSSCSSLTSLNLDSFDTSIVTNMVQMFKACSKLSTTIVIKNSNVTGYSEMFSGAATASGAQITVDYTDATSDMVDILIATKSSNSDVIKKIHYTYNFPNLDNGNLIPVYYDNTAEVWKKADSQNTNNSWYDYDNKMWANAVIVNTSKKSTYQSASVGTTITDADIIAFYVWIPRYKYRVWNITRQGGAESTYAYKAYSTGIEIEFELDTASTGNVKCTYDLTTTESATNLSDKCYYNGSSTAITTSNSNASYTNAWYTHPAFTFGGVEKTGFWIGKFETSGTADVPKVLPDVSSLRNQTLSVQFTTSKKFQTYLSSAVDAHMLTSLEWGAVAYLTHSTYGLCTDNSGAVTCRGLYNNNSASLYTGRSGGAIANGGGGTYGTYNYKGYQLNSSGAATTTKDISKAASTTGNITGVYDLSGGAYDRVMGNMVNSSGAFYPSSSGTSWNGSTTLNSKYYNTYSYGTAASSVNGFNRARLGDATAEVLGSNTTYMGGWKVGSGVTGSDSTIVASSDSWYTRGGVYNSTNASLFNFVKDGGGSDARVTFRSSIS